MTESSVADWNLGTKQFYRPKRWPIRVAFLGFAGKSRHTGEQSVTSGIHSLACQSRPFRTARCKMILLRVDRSRRSLIDNEGQPVCNYSGGF